MNNGIYQYEDVIKDICNVHTINEEDNDEATMHSIYGVAIALSYVNGIDNDLSRISRHLNVDYTKLRVPFERLNMNGAFSNRFNLCNDATFRGRDTNNTSFISGAHRTKIAWCHIAGLASGFVGLQENY